MSGVLENQYILRLVQQLQFMMVLVKIDNRNHRMLPLAWPLDNTCIKINVIKLPGGPKWSIALESRTTIKYHLLYHTKDHCRWSLVILLMVAMCCVPQNQKLTNICR